MEFLYMLFTGLWEQEDRRFWISMDGPAEQRGNKRMRINRRWLTCFPLEVVG